MRTCLIAFCLLTVARLSAGPRIFLDAVHGNPELEMLSETSLAELMELLPEAEFELYGPADLPICRLLLVLELPAPGVYEFNVPEESSEFLRFLYARIEEEGGGFQLGYHRLESPSGTPYYAFENGILLEEPEPGAWTFTLDEFTQGAITRVEVGLGPCFLETYPLQHYDLLLNLPNYVMQLFRGTPTPYSEAENQILMDFMTGGGSIMVARASGIFAEKPIVQLYGIQQPATWEVCFPGRLSYASPWLRSVRRAGDWCFSLPLDPAPRKTIYYEALLDRPHRPLTFQAAGDEIWITNHSGGTVDPCLLYRLADAKQVEVRSYAALVPGGTLERALDKFRVPLAEWTDFLRDTMGEAELRQGLSLRESRDFAENWHWAERIREELDGRWQGLVLYHTDAYDELIPAGGTGRIETVRLLWHLLDPLPLGLPAGFAPPHPPPATEPVCDVYHEYGVLWDGDRRDQLDQQFWSMNFHDIGLHDPTDYWEYVDHIVFHMGQSGSDLAQEIWAAAEQLHGRLATGISGEGLDLLVTGDEDTQDGVEFPAGSYPPVLAAEYHGSGQLIGLSDQGLLAEGADNHALVETLFEYMDRPGVGDDSWLRSYPPVQELILESPEREVVEFALLNMGPDTVAPAAGTHGVPWLVLESLAPPLVAPGEFALARWEVDFAQIENGDFDISLPVEPGGLSFLHAVVNLDLLPPADLRIEIEGPDIHLSWAPGEEVLWNVYRLEGPWQEIDPGCCQATVDQPYYTDPGALALGRAWYVVTVLRGE